MSNLKCFEHVSWRQWSDIVLQWSLTFCCSVKFYSMKQNILCNILKLEKLFACNFTIMYINTWNWKKKRYWWIWTCQVVPVALLWSIRYVIALQCRDVFGIILHSLICFFDKFCYDNYWKKTVVVPFKFWVYYDFYCEIGEKLSSVNRLFKSKRKYYCNNGISYEFVMKCHICFCIENKW